jgi:hypothetical protein
MNGRAVRRMAAKLAATKNQLQARLGLRSSSAAQPHKNKKRFHKADRSKWRKQL